MARLIIENVGKVFGAVTALNDISIDVADGEFLAVLGPSGCGKTTLLRLVAGFEEVTTGSIVIGERRVSAKNLHVPVEDRRIGVVFQSYALWPHMTVSQNVEYPLRVSRVSAEQRALQVNDALRKVTLEGLADRYPAQLSGGQRQRVALARCLVMRPSLVVLDEPLANLDVHLRVAMEQEFAEFHEQTGTTMFYITHDQAEAMALADRIAVLDHGEVAQLASPEKLYSEPANEMVARFIGQGVIVPAQVQMVNGGQCRAQILGQEASLRCQPGQTVSEQASVCLRNRDLEVRPRTQPGVICRVRRIKYQGGFYRVDLTPEVAPDLSLSLDVPGALPLDAEAKVSVAIRSGWVIPQGHPDRTEPIG